MARQKRPRRHVRVRETHEARYTPDPKETPLTGVLFDSDVIIEFLRGRSRVLEAARHLEMSGTPTYCSPISWAEIYAGASPGEKELAESFFHARGEVILDSTCGRRAGDYLARYARSHGVEIADALIAAAASTSELRLWTLNRKHYPMPDVEFYEP
jgi:hypothetical protein